MPAQTRTFRVFVSSTFNDLIAERDALQREAFPKLRKLCEQHGARFQAVDLRWGVREEAALDQKTMEICLREIERCQATRNKPNFIVLLGQRYGWRPLPSRIEAGEFDALRDNIAKAEDRAHLDDWYQLDDNALPPEYLLKPRTGEWADSTRWQAFETHLHRVLLDAARAAGLPEAAQIKYQAAATHQEILKGLGATPQDRANVFAFCRQVPGEACDPDLLALTRFLRAQLPAGNISTYNPGDYPKLCEDVERTLSAVIETEAAGFESHTALEIETDAHDTFARDRALVFGRGEVLGAIAGYLGAPSGRALVLHGASGSGKSAVMAQASEQARTAGPLAVVIRRFIGASPQSTNGLTLFRGITEQIGEAYGITGALPAEFNGVARVFRERIALAPVNRPVIVFIDALDQLGKDDPARAFDWLAEALPTHCAIVLSTSELDTPLSQCRLLKLDVLAQADAAAALDYWLDAARRQLQPLQRARLLAAFSRCGLPLYLKLAFEEARGWGSYFPAEECILGEGVKGVIDALLDRLSLETNHGPLLVSRSLGYLAAARYGLTEDEMLDVLSADEEVWQDFQRRAHYNPPERRMPVLIWSRLFLDLEPYLTERSAPGGAMATFYHRQLAEQAAARFLTGQDGNRRHASLAGYFSAQPHWFDAAQIRPNARKAAELIYQQLASEQIDAAAATLTDLQFVATKCAAGLAFDLQSDYSATTALLPEARPALEEERLRRERIGRWTEEIVEYSRQSTSGKDMPLPEFPPAVSLWSEEQIDAECRRITENPARLDLVESFGQFINAEYDALFEFGKRPGFLVQHAFNHAPAGPVHSEAATQANAVAAPLMLRQWSPNAGYNPKPACLRVLEIPNAGTDIVSVTPDARRLVVACDDGTLRVWDLETGACLRVIDAHKELRMSVTISPDGRRALLASRNWSLGLWDLETGSCLLTLQENKAHQFERVGMTPDARRVVSVDAQSLFEHTIRVWNLETGTCLRTLDGLDASMVRVTPDGRRAVTVGRYLRVWDLAAGKLLREFLVHPAAAKGMIPKVRQWITRRISRPPEVHTNIVGSLALTPDGRTAVTGSWDHTLRVWDLETGTCRGTLKGHRGTVVSVSVTPGGQRAVSASEDKTLGVWNLETCSSVRTLHGHTEGVVHASVTPDGSRAISASFDDTLRIWDLETGACPNPSEMHSQWVTTVRAAPDARRAVSASWDKTLRVWDLETGACLGILEGHEDHVLDVAVTPDGQRAVSASKDKTLRVWDLNTGSCLSKLRGHRDPVPSVAVTPDGRRAVSASWDTTLRVWDLETGACLRTLQGHSKFVTDVSVTPDGRRAVSASHDYTVRVWDLQSGACLRAMDGHSNAITSLVVTPDGLRAVSASDDNTLRVWDLATGACLHILEEHTNRIGRPSLTPDGRRVVSPSRDLTVRLWDLKTGQCLKSLPHSGYVDCVSVTLDGRFAVSSCWDKIVRVWDLETGTCLAIARGDARWTAVTVAGPRIVAGTSNGEVLIFEPGGLASGPAICTAVSGGDSGSERTLQCPRCGCTMPLPAQALPAIALQANNSLPSAAFDDERLRVNCAACGRPIQLNPFLVEQGRIMPRESGMMRRLLQRINAPR